MNRRSFLGWVGAIAASELVGGCTSSGAETLKVGVLKNSIPPQLVSKFRQQFQNQFTLDISPEPSIGDLFGQLQTWKQQTNQPVKDSPWSLPFFGNTHSSTKLPDLVTLGDYWLTNAIKQGLIQPLDLEQLSGWKQLKTEPVAWSALVRRNQAGQLDPEGKIWAAPYRWGTTVIAYRRDKLKNLGWIPTNWSDLWRPEVRDRISLPDSPRAVIGLALKKLGYSYNTENLAQVPNLETQLRQLHQQVRLYSSDAYLQPLLLGDTWLAVGWSTDVLPELQADQKIGVIVPQSGTALWAELWVQPTANTPRNSSPSDLDLVKEWINFCWQPEIARIITLLSKAASPIFTSDDATDLLTTVPIKDVILPDKKILAQSEFLLPLPDQAIAQYRNLWLKIRTG